MVFARAALLNTKKKKTLNFKKDEKAKDNKGQKKKRQEKKKKEIRRKEEVGAECSCYYKFLGTFPEM